MDHDLNAIRKRLIDRRRELLANSDAAEEDRRPVDLDQTSVGRLTRADAVQRQAVALAVERQRGAELQRIEAALQRVDSGDYGYCAACGDEIAPRRLALDPTVPTCIRCARGEAGR